MTNSPLNTVSDLDDLAELEKDATWRKAAEEAEAAIPSHILAGVPQPMGWMKTWPELETYSHYMQMRSLVLRGFAVMLKEVCGEGDIYEAASQCGKTLVFERLFEPGGDFRARLMALIEGEKLGPKVELTPERLTVIRAVLKAVLTTEDWAQIAQAAAAQVEKQMMALAV